MIRYSHSNSTEIEQLLMKHLPRHFLMACEEAYLHSDTKGYELGKEFASSHRSSASGHIKHFLCNEAFHEALLAHGANPTPLRGSRLVIGKLGIFNIARLNIQNHKWTNRRRSVTRLELAEINKTIESAFVQNDLFSPVEPNTNIAEATIFIVGITDVGTNNMSQLTDILIGLPSADMKTWLYFESIKNLIKLYGEADTNTQPDKAIPTLKIQPKKQSNND